MFLHVETSWPCVSPHGQGNCPGSLTVVSDGDSHSVACSKCNLGTVGQGPLPEFWITKLIEQGYLKQLRRLPAEKKALSQVLRSCEWFQLSLQELVDEIWSKFEIFHREEE